MATFRPDVGVKLLRAVWRAIHVSTLFQLGDKSLGQTVKLTQLPFFRRGNHLFHLYFMATQML